GWRTVISRRRFDPRKGQPDGSDGAEHVDDCALGANGFHDQLVNKRRECTRNTSITSSVLLIHEAFLAWHERARSFESLVLVQARPLGSRMRDSRIHDE